MKIQFLGQNGFLLSGQNATVVCDPGENVPVKNVDFVTNSGQFTETSEKIESKKLLSLPGEYEISNVLVRGFFSRPENVVYKIVIDGVAIVHLGSLETKPSTEFFAKLGENVDVMLVTLNEQFGVKEVKELVETLDARYTIIGGDQTLFPKMVEAGARLAEENPIVINQTTLNEEKSEALILTV
jgi:L-ascorbate metabolism protein UlaG (beta-lactamase superfamily)